MSFPPQEVCCAIRSQLDHELLSGNFLGLNTDMSHCNITKMTDTHSKSLPCRRHRLESLADLYWVSFDIMSSDYLGCPFSEIFEKCPFFRLCWEFGDKRNEGKGL